MSQNVQQAALEALESKGEKMIETIRERINKAGLEHNLVERNVLRVVVAESERRPEAKLETIIKKMIESNNETIQYMHHNDKRRETLNAENGYLAAWLPASLTDKDFYCLLFDGNSSEFEQIREAKSEGQAIGIAMKFVKSNNIAIESPVVISVVKTIRRVDAVVELIRRNP